MSDTPETLAAILAEMREWSTDENDALGRYADRIEAAAKRLVKEAKEGIWRNAEEIHDIHCNDCTLRAALVEIIERTKREKARDYKAALDGGILEIHDIANTALNETKGA